MSSSDLRITSRDLQAVAPTPNPPPQKPQKKTPPPHVVVELAKSGVAQLEVLEGRKSLILGREILARVHHEPWLGRWRSSSFFNVDHSFDTSSGQRADYGPSPFIAVPVCRLIATGASTPRRVTARTPPEVPPPDATSVLRRTHRPAHRGISVTVDGIMAIDDPV
jgi:hypothetical protein